MWQLNRYSLCCLLVLVVARSCGGYRLEGYSLVEVLPETLEQVKLVSEFAKSYRNDEVNFQFIRPPYAANVTISIIVSPRAKVHLQRLFEDNSMGISVVIGDVQRLIDEQNAENKDALLKRLFRTKRFSEHSAYLRYHQIQEWILRKTKDISYANFTKFGQTFEKRKLFMVKISKDSSLPIVWLDGGTHAREWITISSVLFVLDKLLQDSPETMELLSKYQFMIVPLVNPDGYEYSHDGHRLWRKNRSKSPNQKCVGVDLNRNYPYKWGGHLTSSNNPCDDIYRGPSAASESEVQAITTAMIQMKDQLRLVVNVHSFGQYIVYPYSFSTTQYPSNYLQMISVAMRTCYNILNKHQTMYGIGRPSELFSPLSGTSDDFAIGVLKVPFSFGIVLPDRFKFRFLLPPRFIRPIGEQLWEIMYSFGTEIAQYSP